jgi:hypothetical protein
MSSIPVVPEVIDPDLLPLTPEQLAAGTKRAPALIDNDSLTAAQPQRIEQAKQAVARYQDAASFAYLKQVAESGNVDVAAFLEMSGMVPRGTYTRVNAQGAEKPAKYTRASMAKMSNVQFQELRQNPTELAKMKADLEEEERAKEAGEVAPATETPTPEAEEAQRVAAAAEVARLAAEAEVARQAEEARVAQEAEAARVAEAARIAAEEAAKPKVKIVRTYQVKDEQGRPIGKPTHLEADTWEEMAEKMQGAHENAMRYAERIKNRKLTPAPAPPPAPLSEADLLVLQKELETGNAAQKAEAIRKIANDQFVKDNTTLRQELAQRDRVAIANDFVKRHVDDYEDNVANSAILMKYLTDNKLAWTPDNFDAAFDAVYNQLAPKAVSALAVTPTPTPNPAPVVAATIPVVAAPPLVQPTPAPAPVAPVAVVPAPAAVVPAVVVSAPNVAPAVTPPITGVQPGELSGVPASAATAPVKLTKKDIINMPKDELKRRMKNPDFVTYANRLLAGK